mgnify:CR=1 FL=1
METDYTLNTLMISADEKAYISCIRGFWIIDPKKGTRHYMPTLRTRKGNVLATEISTIFQDQQGGFMARNIQQRIAVLPSGPYISTST